MKILLQTLKGEETERVPFWYMRQAGRYLPEFAEFRKEGFLNMLLNFETMASVSSLPLRYYDPDGIIIFSDLLVPLLKTGRMIHYDENLRISEDYTAKNLYDRISRSTSKALNKLSQTEKTVIGFVGGPFTVASYIFDGRKTGYPETKRILEEGALKDQLDPVIDAILDYAKVQVNAGVEVIQIFDSWIGSLSSNLFRKYLNDVEKDFVEDIKRLGKPVIFFAEGASHLYNQITELSYDCISIDWRLTLDQFSKIDNDRPVQGNLDPYLLSSDTGVLMRETDRILEEGKRFRGHVFNLGHGIPPYTDVKKLIEISDRVRQFRCHRSM
ncbi:MAG: hypothetical protein LVQ96_07640 [Thermoplasmatales archaeon]|nr:hypothetical protein [Thermoplasmatales archaeon]MCW6171028.1 hypothetical protein [Thermoplasmatales archaeon]